MQKWGELKQKPPNSIGAMGPPAHTPSTRQLVPNADPSVYPKEQTFTTCCSFFIFLWLTPIAVVFFYNAYPTTILAVCIMLSLCSVLPWAFHAGGHVTSDWSGPALTVTLFFSKIIAFLGGVRCYYAHALPLRSLSVAREYKHVYPGLPATVFEDAAYIKFVHQAKVDSTKAASYMSLNSGLTTFCAAPVVTNATDRMGFWAVGVDCCGTNGDTFECDDAGEPGVRNGLVLPHHADDPLYSALGVYVSPAEHRRDAFAKAVQKAAATYGMVTPSAEEAIFVRWTKKTKGEIMAYETMSIVITIILMTAQMGAVSFFMTRLYQRFSYVKGIHKKRLRAEDMADLDEETLSGRVRAFKDHAFDDVTEVVEDSGARDAYQKAKDQVHLHVIKKAPLSRLDMCLMGVLLPYVALMFTVVLQSFSPCLTFGYLIVEIAQILLTIFVLAIIITPNRLVTGLFLLLTQTVGSYIGHTNYQNNMFHYCSVADRRTYENVPADANTAHYWDAGSLEFNTAAKLSGNHSVGFLYHGVSYCVAPVISTTAPCQDKKVAAAPKTTDSGSSDGFLQVDRTWSDEAISGSPAVTHGLGSNFLQRRSARHRSARAKAVEPVCVRPAPARVDFWAVGKDCCDGRGRFWCDGGEEDGARSAVVIRPHEDEVVDADGPKVAGGGGAAVEQVDVETPKLPSDRRNFFDAIDQAVAAYSLPPTQRPVLLRWGTDAKKLQGTFKSRAIGVIFVTGIASLLIIAGIGLISFLLTKRARRDEQERFDDFDRRMSTLQSGQDAGEDKRSKARERAEELLRRGQSGSSTSQQSLAPNSGILNSNPCCSSPRHESHVGGL